MFPMTVRPSLCRQAAVAAAEAAAAAAAEERLVEAVAQQQARVAELQSEVQRLRSSAQTYLRDEREVRVCVWGGGVQGQALIWGFEGTP